VTDNSQTWGESELSLPSHSKRNRSFQRRTLHRYWSLSWQEKMTHRTKTRKTIYTET